MLSMTGYGKGVGAFDGRELTIELKSVNHRFLDVGVKLPRTLIYAEDSVRKILQSRLSRGHVDVFVTLVDKREGVTGVRLDKSVVKTYVDLAKEVSSEYGIPNDFGVTALLKVPDVISHDVVDQDGLSPLIEEVLNEAIDGLIQMREAEGEALKKDLLSRIKVMREMLSVIVDRAPQVAEDYRVKLTERLTEILGGVIDEARVLQEVAIFTDKANIDEEITRLTAHFDRAVEYTEDNSPVGRRLDFLVQEMNREMNTIGSKSNDVIITEQVLKLKNELEKVREQVQNLE